MDGHCNENYNFGIEQDCVLSEQVSWTNNPLFCIENNSTDSILQDLVETNERLRNDVNLKNVEFETESGYAESISILSALSSPAPSISSHVSLSEDETEVIDEITENMRQASIEPPPGIQLDLNTADSNTKQIISSKGTVRGVRNRVRDNILHFLSSSQSGNKQSPIKCHDNPV